MIDNYAFEECTSLKSIQLPDALDTIGYCAFQNCSSLEQITIPEKVTVLEQMIFAGCKNLKSISLPAGITEIKIHAFRDCSSLETIVFAGTTAQWETVVKESGWNPHDCSFEVVCSDGTLQIDGFGRKIVS